MGRRLNVSDHVSINVCHQLTAVLVLCWGGNAQDDGRELLNRRLEQQLDQQRLDLSWGAACMTDVLSPTVGIWQQMGDP